MAGQPEHIYQLAEAGRGGRGWPRLAEAGGRPELDLRASWCYLVFQYRWHSTDCWLMTTALPTITLLTLVLLATH